MLAEADTVRLIDQHCHGVWRGPLSREEFEAGLTESHQPPPPGTSSFDSQLGVSVRRWCAPLLDLAPHAAADEYVTQRANLGDAEVHRRMLSAAGLAALFVDCGFRSESLVGVDQMSRLAGVPAYEIVRLETVAENMAAGGGNAADLISGYPDALAAASRDAVALKSVAAYRCGLDFDPERPSDEEVLAAADRWIDGLDDSAPPRITDPVLARFVLWCGVDRGLPLQFHCGFGDPDLTLHRADPSLLTGFIRAVQPHETPVVLLHNYPFHRHAAYLAQAFSNVYADLGLAITHAGPGATAIVAETLEIAPFHKLLYSSDGFALAELHYLGAMRFRRALSEVLENRVRADELSLSDAERSIRLVGHLNAERLYGSP